MDIQGSLIAIFSPKIESGWPINNFIIGVRRQRANWGHAEVKEELGEGGSEMKRERSTKLGD